MSPTTPSIKQSSDLRTSDTAGIAGRRRKLALATGLTLGSIGVAAGGFSGSAGAIVDGTDASVSDNRWQVALTSQDGEQFCGGSIVSDRVIVTAAHCVQGTPEGDIAVRAGATDLTSDDGQTRNVTKVIEHPKYAQGVGDIAMLVLDRPFDASPDIASIPLATADDIARADSARVTGWGVTSETADDTPAVLQTADVPLVDDADCSLVDEGNDDELCAGGTGTDSCFGDSGGPLTVATENGRALAGVVSWGEECGGETAGVYAEVPTFAEWISERVADPDAPAGDRLPAPDSSEGAGGEGEIFEIEQEFIDSLGDEIDTLSDDEFFERYEAWLEERGTDAGDASDAGESEADDVESDDLDDVDDFEDFDVSDLDLNGDNIVQWSELEPDLDTEDDSGADDDSFISGDTNGDDIVQWSELLSV